VGHARAAATCFARFTLMVTLVTTPAYIVLLMQAEHGQLASDNQDMIAIYFDASATEMSRKLYDDSANSWAESSILTSVNATIINRTNVTSSLGGAVRHSDNVVVICFWNHFDNATADLKCYFISETAITAKTDVITDKDDCMGAAVFIDQNNNYIYVAYIGKNDGAEVVLSDVHIYYQLSTDDGSTWNTAVQVSVTLDDHRTIGCDMGRTAGRFYPVWFNDDLNRMVGNYDNSISVPVSAGNPARPFVIPQAVSRGAFF
jgi:hypothetical protein